MHWVTSLPALLLLISFWAVFCQFYCVQLLVFLVYFYRLWNCSTIIPNLMGKLFCSWMEIAPCWSGEKSIIRDAMQFWTLTGFNFALQFRWADGETLFSPTFSNCTGCNKKQEKCRAVERAAIPLANCY